MNESDDLVSQRAAARILKDGLGLSRRHADRVLAAGLAGKPIRTAGLLLYELGRVQRLVTSPHVDAAYVDGACPHGYFLSRRPVGADIEELSGGWVVAWIGTIWMQMQVDHHGALPLIATVAGFVVRGADIIDVDFSPDGRAAFDLQPPGDWFRHLEGRRFATGPGRECVVRLPGWSPSPLKYATASTCARMWP